MKATESKAFNIKIETTDGQKETIEVKYKETTDGIPFYECLIHDEKIQLRKDGKWEQIWGSLSPGTIEKLGAEIDKAH